MGLEQRLIQSQKLILSPQLRQYLKLLQLPILELRQAVETELEENPVLEEVPMSAKNEVSLSDVSSEDPPASKEQREEELVFQDKIAELDRIDEEYRDTIYHEGAEPSEDEIKDSAERKNYQESIVTRATTLADYLLWQLSYLTLDESGTRIAEEIIGNVDGDGYLRAEVAEIAQELAVEPEAVEKVLKEVQTLDPPGVSARTLQEALLIQLAKKDLDSELPKRIVAEAFALLERKHFSEIAKHLGVSESKVTEAFQAIAHLEPKPGRVFYANEPVAIVPDATIAADEQNPDAYKIEIHQESIPHLKISRKYRDMLKDKKIDQKTRAFLRNKLNSALWLMQAIGQRKTTLRMITEELVIAQKEFFERGFSHLKPLRLKDIAEKIKIHESTVSRAIALKYVSTPQGTIPYRSFFSSKLETEGGGEESQKSIMEKIRALVTAEDKKKPLSDAKIVKLLQAEGVKIARRTVTKYRELLKILPTHLRKVR
jgi:RNA polymerase sigma-54 factor